jgi:IS5 family transposase
VTADRSYGEKAIDDDLHKLGIRYVVIPRKGNPARRAKPSSTAAPSAAPSSGAPAANGGSAPSRASTAGTAPAWTSTEGARTWAGYGVLARNLVKISALTT